MRNIRLLAILGLPLLPGCVHVPSTDERAVTSMSVGDLTFEGQAPREYLRERTGYVVSGCLGIERIPVADDPGRVQLRFVANAPGSLRIGTATAIDARGYFVTSSHNVNDPSPWMVFKAGGRTRAVRARIVWKGDVEKGELDLAILAVPGSLDHVMAWSDPVEPGDGVLGVGPSRLDTTSSADMSLALFAGKVSIIVARPGTGRAPNWLRIVHNAPLRPGDSGGPLVSSDGRLVAIEALWVRAVGQLNNEQKLTQNMQGIAVRPALGWFRGIIEADYSPRAQLAQLLQQNDQETESIAP